jgi:hypothetical protein
MIPAELLGLDYHPPQASPLPDYLLGRSRLETSREQGAAQQEELGRHNRVEEEIGKRGLDIRELHEKLSSAVNERKLAHKLDAERTKLWHQLNLARIDAVAKGDTVKAAQLSATLDALESEGEQSGPEAAPQEAAPAPAAEPPPEHFEPLSPFNYSFGPGGARVGTPPPAPEPPPEATGSVTPQQNVTEPPGPPIAAAPEEPVDTQALGRRLAAEAFGRKNPVIELPERPEDIMVSALPKAASPLDPFDPLSVPIEQGTYTREANDKTPPPQAGPEEARAAEGRTRNIPGGGQMREPLQSANPRVAAVAEMYRGRASRASGAEKDALDAAADAASMEQTPKDAQVAAERSYKNSMAQWRKVYPHGAGGGGGGPAQPSEKDDRADYKADLDVAKNAENITKTARKGVEDADRTISLLTEGMRTGFKDRDALESHLRSVVQTRINLQQLKMTQEAAGKMVELENGLNTLLKGGKFADEYVRQMIDAAQVAKEAAGRAVERTAAATDYFLENRYHGRSEEDKARHKGGVRALVTGEIPEAPAAKGEQKEKSSKRQSLEERARKAIAK